MAGKKKGNARERLLALVKKRMEEEGLSPVTVKDKKTGETDVFKTSDVTLKSLDSKLAKELGPEFMDRYINDMEKKGLDMKGARRSNRVAKAENKIRMKKATGPELTTPPKKRKGAAKGALIGPKYRHGHKDYRKGGVATRMK